jgi:succinate-acetate transporter protein
MPEKTYYHHDVEAQITEHTVEDAPVISKVVTSGDHNEIIHIGNTLVNKDELMAAFGGTMWNGPHLPPSRKLANPSVLGLCSFALTTFVLGLVNVQARGLKIPSIMIGLALFYGGAVQLIVGMWEIVVENTFGCTTFASYGAFYLSYAAIQMDSFGIVSAYGDDEGQLFTALGFWALGWFIFTSLMTVCTIRATWPLFTMFASIAVTLLLIVVGYLCPSEMCIRVSGGTAIFGACVGWYLAMGGLCSPETTYFKIHPFYMPGARKDLAHE